MLNNKKSQAILQWFNSLTTKGDVNSLVQFSDGSHFLDIVVSLEEIIPRENNSTSTTICEGIASNEDNTSVEEGAEKEKTETSVSESENDGPFVNKEADIQKKYDVIRKFIDDFYHIESSSLISYDECQNGKELELAKVAVFLLTAMVQTLLCVENETVFNAALLEPEIQVNIHECMSYIFDNKDSEENQFKKAELHRILSRPASFKATPVRRRPSRSTSDPSDFSEDVKNFSKKRRERTSAVMYEDLQDSPLRNLLESPKIKYTTAMFRKDSELTKLRNAFLNEENKVMDLTAEKRTLNEELEKRNKEIEFYKKELESQREAFCEKEEQERLKTEELKDKEMEEKRLKKRLEAQEEEIKQLLQNIETLQMKVEEAEKKQKQDKTASLIKENSDLKDKIGTLELDSERKVEEINALNEKIANLENDLNKYQQMYQEYSASNNKEELTGSPNVPETLSAIIYTDELISKETLERKDQVLKEDVEEDRIKQILKLKTRNADLIKDIQDLKAELVIIKEKYVKIQQLVKKKDADAKKLLMVVAKIPGGLTKIREFKNRQRELGESRYQNFIRQSKEEITKKCEECEIAQKSIKDLSKELEEFKHILFRFQLNNHELKKMERNAKLENGELRKKIEELEQELWLERSSLSENTADRDIAIAHYMFKKKQELPKKSKDKELKIKRKEQKNSSELAKKISLNADDEQSTSNSLLASGSMHNRFFQTADEEDFLSESSLADIYNINILDDANGENRLEELRRRNTLCPPHLQSSYPLEIQDMTPSEKKYYVPKETSFNPGRNQEDIVPPKNSRDLEADYEDADDSNTFPMKKRKVAETMSKPVPVPVSKTSSSVAKAKSSTPLKQGLFVSNFFEEDEVAVTAVRYMKMLEEFFLPQLDEMDVGCVWFQQDGATARTAIRVLREHFSGRLISLKGDLQWPPRSPDMGSYDNVLWGVSHPIWALMTIFYGDRPRTLAELKDDISQEIANIRIAMLERVDRNFRNRVTQCIVKRGRHLFDTIFKTMSIW
ncbi:hypothetical protein HNY73_012697 [Argiope bruennichi]|uniref:Uncharacterized protein n=1 Tax=Argiope bruennichi TaxID=94029 RepID=A0A8T0EXW8_ARGBR|nr:hypothetical protein HNY73_012697 [Argiope bruennichi]